MASVAPEISILACDEAFEKLYRRYVKDVYHYALALLRNPADAEDVTQTTFMNAYRAYRRGDRIEKPQNWLIKIAHNVARTRYARSSRRVKEVPLEGHVEQLAVPEEERPNVAGVLRALGRLPFNQRAALVMRELEGRSYGEIADTLGVSVAAVETLIFRARRSLRLRASALRSLGAVPLPASLAGLFEGGAVVAGGGAFFGTGFILKAAVALLAGAVATGLGGGHGNPAAASPGSQAAGVVSGPAAGTFVLPGSIVKSHGFAVRGVPRGRAALDRPFAADEVLTGDPLGLSVVVASATAGAASSPTATSAGSAPVTAPVTAPVDGAVETAQTAVSAAVPSPPVQAPSAPPLPVKPPALPVQPPPLPVQPPPLPVQPPPPPKLP